MAWTTKGRPRRSRNAGTARTKEGKRSGWWVLANPFGRYSEHRSHFLPGLKGGGTGLPSHSG